MTSLPLCLDEWARIQPNELLYAFYDRQERLLESVSYGAFAKRTKALASMLAARGVCNGERVLLLHPPGLELITALFACARLGALGVVGPISSATAWRRPAVRDRLVNIIKDCEPTFALSLAVQVEEIRRGTPALKNLSLLGTDGDLPDGDDLNDTPNDICFLQYTSGSTSRPKGVLVLHKNIVANARAVLDHKPVTVSWLPQFHDMGLIGYYLFPVVLGGCTHGFTPNDFLSRPALWLRMISRYRATFSSAPNFAFDYCLEPGRITTEDLEGVDLSCLRTLLNGAEPVLPSTCRQFNARFAPYDLRAGILVGAYGLAEATLAVTKGGFHTTHFDRAHLSQGIAKLSNDSSNMPVELASCGVPLANLAVSITSPTTGEPLGEGYVGDIRITGPSVTPGYWSDLEQQVGTPWPLEPAGTSTSCTICTHDRGFLWNSELYVCGRSADLLIRRGANHFAADIEANIVDDAIRVRGTLAFQAEDGAITVLVEPQSSSHLPDLALLNHKLTDRIGFSPDLIVVVPRRSIVWTSSGKRARSETQRRFESGGIKVLKRYQPLQLAHEGSTVLDLIRISLAKAPYAAQATVADCGLDSLQLVELELALEQRLQACLGVDELYTIDGHTLLYLMAADVLALVSLCDSKNALQAREFAEQLLHQGARAQDDEQIQMERDRELSLPPLQSSGKQSEGTTERIVLTGGTGFFGPYLLRNLLMQTTGFVYLIVRAINDTEAERRTRAALEEAGMFDVCDAPSFRKRVIVWQGDVSLPLLGLTPARYSELHESSCSIYHNAAEVNYVHRYDSMRSSNVIGTRNVLELALGGAPKVLHYVSSTFIYGWTRNGVLHEEDCNSSMTGLDFGYSQTKWVAEQLVLRAAEDGLSAIVYRPSLITVSTSARGDTNDVAARLLAFMIKYKVAVLSDNQLSLLPVDVLANNLVAIAKTTTDPTVLHLTCDRYYSFSQLTQMVTILFGFQFTYLDIPSFITTMNALALSDDPIYPLLNFFTRSASYIAAMSLKRYDNTQYRSAREKADGAIADPSLQTLTYRLVRFLMSKQWVESSASQSITFMKDESIAEDCKDQAASAV